MNRELLILLDYFFLIFHSLFTIFNIFGWISKKTRKIHLVTVGLTLFSWFFLGIWYGWGYCFCTQWHWEVRMSLGDPIYSQSYIHFLLLEISGINFSPQLVDYSVFIVFLFCVLITIILNIRDYRKTL